ncbi:sigma factor G inhibitor Gin [Clostridium intestinale]|nr:sigma factor G inhibitor Gin [Clostridium intestinale]
MMKKNCIICGKANENGIIICGKEICLSCEKAIANEPVYTDRYEFYKRKIKRYLSQPINYIQ